MKGISFVSKKIGVSTSTIRRWDREGLIPFEVGRDSYNRRVFSDDQIQVLIHIRDMMARKMRGAFRMETNNTSPDCCDNKSNQTWR